MKFLLVFLFSIIVLTAYSQVYSFIDTIPYRFVGLSKKDCMNKFKDKLATIKVSDSLSISLSDEDDVFTGKGKLPYNHIINFDTTDAFINKTYTGQTKGYITFNVRIEFQKKLIVITLHNFVHIALGTPWGKKSAGKINFTDAPIRTKDEELVWLERVRKDIANYCERFNTRFKLWFFNSLL
ncbi:MAG: hypothetical protein HY958_05355 [Bacteroidia bacterium]|nr:hypothetical protein [Bacteroidia bacterium]